MYKKKMYSYGFIVPAGIIFTVFFLIPIVISFYYSLTVWNFDSATFCGLDNYFEIKNSSPGAEILIGGALREEEDS